MSGIDFQAWDLLGLFVFALIGALVTGFNLKRQGTPLPAPVLAPSPVQVAADKQMAQAELKAQEAHEKAVVEATKGHDQAVAKQVQELVRETGVIKDDTYSTHAVLLDIGKQLRDGK